MTTIHRRQTIVSAGATVSLVAVSAAAILFCLLCCRGASRSDSPMQDGPGPDYSARRSIANEVLAYVSEDLPGHSTSVGQPSARNRLGGVSVFRESPLCSPLCHLSWRAGGRPGNRGRLRVSQAARPCAGRFRLVSTSNNVPTRDDLHAVLMRGMPGSAMPPWAHLPLAERDALVDEIMRLRVEGAYEFYVQQLKADEDLTDDEIAAEDVQQEIKEYVHDFTTPGQSTSVPVMEPATDAAISRGKDVYAKFVCISCHGKTGRGDGVQEMWDDEKMPTSPRDFTLGIFKGNPDPASLYRRIAYGMPGTPMPGSGTMTPEQMVDLVHYIRSLSTEGQRQLAVLSRETIVAKTVAVLPEDFDTEAWSATTSVVLRMTPLWWRDNADPDLHVQAVHDGRILALRLSWKDSTRDERATTSASFEDAVACQLYRGDAEPFLGMGSAGQSVDVWFWDADRQTHTDVENVNPTCCRRHLSVQRNRS